MKNKEIELILMKLKIVSEEKENGAYICDKEHSKLLLSYIEQLKKRNKEIYEGFMATQEELTDYATKNEQLENENQQLKKQKDDVVEYIKTTKLIDYDNDEVDMLKDTYVGENLLRMLGEIDE